MTILFAGLDHIATLRQAGGLHDPDPVIAAALAELAGAGGLSISLGRERPSSPGQAEGRGMQERDLRLLRETARCPVNVCLPPLDEWVKLALAARPDLVTLTPEGREGLGAERCLDVEDRRQELSPVIETLRSGGIGVSVLVEPAPAQVKAAQRAGATAVLLDCARYCWAGDAATRAAVAAAVMGQRHDELVPLLIGHDKCPGFTAPPLGERDWQRLIARTARLQFARPARTGWLPTQAAAAVRQEESPTA